MKSRALKTYITGFVFSLVLTLTAYFVVTSHAFSGLHALLIILTAALLQFIVQLVFFLHLDEESKPRWNLLVLLSTVSLVLIMIIGSLWIMANLNYRHIAPDDIIKDEGIQF